MTRYQHSWGMGRNLPGPHGWNSFPQLTDSLLTLTTKPVNIQDDTIHCIEMFVVLLYDRTMESIHGRQRGQKELTLRQEELCPPHPTNYDALKQQDGYVWGQALVP
ncbi:hypothetical protein Pmani_020486 [Petrolisthes manimaculis]|uniref:Uncharacterized protein n=1 Tax=Petrolisthes manimaculis TaxID=1843537 RepID=A0AAE1U2J1_9EUCA|nr:hypothetical protein Pmani_020486 [Petrolisthes manimaculis]